MRRIWGLLWCLVALTGCFQAGYVVQAGVGQETLGFASQPLAEAIANRDVEPYKRELLRIVPDVKQYGERHALKATSNYEHYVALDRPVVVYVVVASHPFRFESKTWWFPIVGNVPYLGWFQRSDAVRYAKRLRKAGWDVHLRGASAYSTLGFFDDPILSSMIRTRASVVGDLVNVILHESVHATYYVPSQSAFNESLADFVADELTLPYLDERLGLDRWQIHAYVDAQVRREQRGQKMFEGWQTLDRIYRSNLAPGIKLAAKNRVLDHLEQEIGYRKLNNAVLSQSRTYRAGLSDFDELFEHCGRDWDAFWAAVRTITPRSFPRAQIDDLGPVVGPLIQRPCTAG
ncbi:MAG: aminopeptidase [Myxococcota bacterium]